MAITGRKKYLVREMLASNEPENIRLAEIMLKSAGYTNREIEHWKEHLEATNKLVKEREKRLNFPFRDFNKAGEPFQWLVGPEGHRLMKELFSVKMEDKEEIGGGTKL